MSSMPILQHIQALRVHILRSLLWLIGCSCLAFCFMQPIISYLKIPYEKFSFAVDSSAHALNNLTAISVFEVMTMNLKLSFFIGLIISLPFITFEIWKFVSPGLYPHERVFGRILMFLGISFFYSGIVFGYFLIIPFFFQSALFVGLIC